MGNNYTVSNISSRNRDTIEIIMADDNSEISNLNNIPKHPDAYTHIDQSSVMSQNSTISINSITSATQTEPDLFTHGPKQQVMFRWLNRFKFYPLLLLKSQQFLHIPSKMALNKLYSDSNNNNVAIRCISLSTQTINKVSRRSIISTEFNLKTKLFRSNKLAKSTECILEEPHDYDILNQRGNDKNNNYHDEDDSKENAPSKQFNNLSLYRDVLPVKKQSVKRKKRTPPYTDITLSRLSNDYYRNQLNFRSRENNISTDTLTTITRPSKFENTSLIYRANGKPYKCRAAKLRRFNSFNNQFKLGVKCQSFSQLNEIPSYKDNKIKPIKNSTKTPAKITRKRINGDIKSELCYLDKAVNDNYRQLIKPFSITFKFWISANKKNWDVFHNPEDRRIESIGRTSQCRIQLTNTILRHSNGLLKQRVVLFAPNHSALEKCCKLFDDKFPEFYATSGLLKMLYYRNNGTFNVDQNYKQNTKGYARQPFNYRPNNFRYKRRKKTHQSLNHQTSNLGFLKNELINF